MIDEFLNPEIQELIEEYKEHDATIKRVQAEHPTPHTGGEEYDYFTVREDMDWRWATHQQSEIEQKIGRLFIEHTMGIKR